MAENNGAPKISIIVPVYNVEKYLRRCLDSIVAQTFNDWECILIDDGSPDNSGAICDEYAEKDSCFRVIHQKNAGVSAARNAGLDVARGEWISFVDSDDWCTLDMLESLLHSAEENDAEVVIGGYSLNDGNKDYETRLPPEGKMSMPKYFDGKWQGPWAKLIKKSFLHKFNIRFPEGISLAEDLFFTFQLFFYSSKICGLKNNLYFYYQNQMSACHTIDKKKIEEECFVINKIEKIIESYNKKSDWIDFLEQKKLRAKNRYLFSLEKPDFYIWRKTFPKISAKTYWQEKNSAKLLYTLVILHFDTIAKLAIFINGKRRK